MHKTFKKIFVHSIVSEVYLPPEHMDELYRGLI